MNWYLALKSLHIVAIISWMAGILYLFRLFVYHAEWGAKSEDNHKMLCVMEQKLMRFIMHPAMGIAWVAGLWMIAKNPLLMKQGWWLHAKLLFVVFLTIITILSGRIHRNFKNRQSSLSGKKLRLLNEVPTVLMILIVVLVIFRP